MSFIHTVVPYNEHSYQILNDFIRDAHSSLSFFGEHRVYSKDNTEYIPLIELMEKISELVESNPHFSDEECLTGENIERKISELYDEAIEQGERASLITKFFMLIFSLNSIVDGNYLYNAFSEMPSFSYARVKKFGNRNQREHE